MEKPRRRSLFEGRRKSAVFDQLTNSPKREATKESDVISIQAYIEQLKTEKAQWKHILQKVKTEVKESRSQHQPQCFKETDVLPQLSLEDQDFLNQKPDYKEMLKFTERFVIGAWCVERYKSNLIESYDQVVQKAEDRINKVFDRLNFQNGCDVCNDATCSLQHMVLQ